MPKFEARLSWRTPHRKFQEKMVPEEVWFQVRWSKNHCQKKPGISLTTSLWCEDLISDNRRSRRTRSSLGYSSGDYFWIWGIGRLRFGWEGNFRLSVMTRQAMRRRWSLNQRIKRKYLPSVSFQETVRSCVTITFRWDHTSVYLMVMKSLQERLSWRFHVRQVRSRILREVCHV